VFISLKNCLSIQYIKYFFAERTVVFLELIRRNVRLKIVVTLPPKYLAFHGAILSTILTTGQRRSRVKLKQLQLQRHLIAFPAG